MGVLYKAAVAEKRLKKNFILERLQGMSIQVSQQGIPIDQLSYEELKYEYVLASFRDIDTDRTENTWF